MKEQDTLEAMIKHGYGLCDSNCPYAHVDACTQQLIHDALDIIQMRDKQLEVLQGQLENVKAERDRVRGAGMVKG